MPPLLSEWRKSLLAPATGVAWVVLSVLSVVAGPFGTHAAMSLAQRATYWPLIVALSILIGTLARVAVRRWLGGFGFFVQAPAIALTLVVLLAPLIHLVTRWLAEPLQVPGIAGHKLCVYVAIASLSVSALREALGATDKAPDPPAPAAPTPIDTLNQPRIFARLEPGLHARLIRLSVNDHYVEVVTEAGATNLLMRFADALAEVEGVPGLRVHRSHWVAEGAVRGGRRAGGRVLLLLSDGVEVPVSRPNLAAVEARGWITRGAASE